MKYLAVALYVPLLSAVAYNIFLCAALLAHGRPAGAYGLLYAAVLYFLGGRVTRIWRGQAERLWLDAAALSVADALLLVVIL